MPSAEILFENAKRILDAVATRSRWQIGLVAALALSILTGSESVELLGSEVPLAYMIVLILAANIYIMWSDLRDYYVLEDIFRRMQKSGKDELTLLIKTSPIRIAQLSSSETTPGNVLDLPYNLMSGLLRGVPGLMSLFLIDRVESNIWYTVLAFIIVDFIVASFVGGASALLGLEFFKSIHLSRPVFVNVSVMLVSLVYLIVYVIVVMYKVF